MHNPTPQIVPLATSLVYDVTTNNSIGAKTFVLPIVYVVDQAMPGQFAVNRFGATQAPAQGATSPGTSDYRRDAPFFSPGSRSSGSRRAAKATQLTANGSPTQTIMGGNTFITARYQTSSTYGGVASGSSVVTGVTALTCTALFPLATFANQNILGFYRDNSWGTSLGFPVFDYKDGNSSFAIANTAAAINPQLVYDPSSPFLNGGSLPNVLAKFAAATYILSPDALRIMIADAGSYTASGAAAGLSVMSATLKFDMTSKPSAGVTDQLSGARHGHGDDHTRNHRGPCHHGTYRSDRERQPDTTGTGWARRSAKRGTGFAHRQDSDQCHYAMASRARPAARGTRWQYFDGSASFPVLCPGRGRRFHSD